MVMNQKKKGRFTSDSTVSARLADPALSKLAPFSSEKLPNLQKRLASCVVIQNDAGIKYSNFVANLKGMTPVPVAGSTLVALRTRSSLFVMTNVAPESLYDNAPGLMNVDFKRRCTVSREDGKCMYLCMITSGELNQILRVSAQEKATVHDMRTISPEVNEDIVSFDEFQRKLAACEVVISPDPEFDIKRLAAELKFVSLFRDKEDNQYYLLMAGEDEIPYRMYVNQEHLSTLDSIVLTYNEDTCILVREE
jgi:hypothetical protein